MMIHGDSERLSMQPGQYAEGRILRAESAVFPIKPIRLLSQAEFP